MDKFIAPIAKVKITNRILGGVDLSKDTNRDIIATALASKMTHAELKLLETLLSV